MTTAPVWRPLPPAPGLPNLLVSTTFSATAYTIYVTDMASIWVESMDRKSIYQRSLNESTSIDPTDGLNNMRAFLSKIRSVFDPSHQDHDRASMTLSTSPSKESGKDGLTMRITCELENVQPLVWPVYLQKCHPSQLATELVLPITRANSAKTRQIDSLLTIIKQKDIVITKLLDKLEASGTRLENVFTVLLAKQKPTREMAEEKVKGLAPFRPDEWKSQTDDGEEDMAAVIQHVFGASGLEYRHQADEENLLLDNWWAKPASPISIVAPKSTSRQSTLRVASPEPQNGRPDGKETNSHSRAEDEDDDFQLQSTPPHVIPSRNRPATAAPTIAFTTGDDDTGDEDISQIPDSVPVPPQDLKSHPTRLKTIEKRQQSTRSSPDPKNSRLEWPETETESEDDAKASVAEPASALKESVHERKRNSRGGLGHIGGGKRHSKSPESPKVVGSPKKGGLGRIGGAARHSQSPEPPKKAGLGRIGGSARPSRPPEPPVADTEDRVRGRHRTESKPQEKPRETSQERADRKRDQLEKELQRKTASAPPRKKRKF